MNNRNFKLKILLSIPVLAFVVVATNLSVQGSPSFKNSYKNSEPNTYIDMYISSHQDINRSNEQDIRSATKKDLSENLYTGVLSPGSISDKYEKLYENFKDIETNVRKSFIHYYGEN